jgi:hypothetical protein
MVPAKAVSLWLTPLTLNAPSISSLLTNSNGKPSYQSIHATNNPIKLSPHHRPLRDTWIEMPYHGTWQEPLRTAKRFRCPLKTSKKFAQNYPLGCPVNHVSFNGHGYPYVTDEAKSRVSRNSSFYKQIFNLHTKV